MERKTKMAMEERDWSRKHLDRGLRIFVTFFETTGSPSSIYDCYVTRAICIFVRICKGKITIVSVTYENVAI